MGNIKSCRKYENPITFRASHKLFMDCNHRPTVRGVDDAIWKRLKLIRLKVQIPDEAVDKKLIDKLLAESQGILAWAVARMPRLAGEGAGRCAGNRGGEP